MIDYIRAVEVQHFAQGDLRAMVSPDTMARIKTVDPHPEFRAYVIGHEGSARGKLAGSLKNITIQYFKDAVRKLHNAVGLGTKVFSGHRVDNSHEGRTDIGEVVGKTLDEVNGLLSSVVAVYVKPSFRKAKKDVASIEADCVYRLDQAGNAVLDQVTKLTGLALGDSAVETPGFPGATLVGALQAFADTDPGKGDGTMTVEEIKKALQAGEVKISQLLGLVKKEDLEADERVQDLVKDGNQTQYERARKMTEQRDKARDDLANSQKRVEELETQVKRFETGTHVPNLFDKLATDRKMTDQQKAFISRRLGNFKSEATDEKTLTTELNQYLDQELEEYKETAKLLGVKEEGGQQGDGGQDGGQGNQTGAHPWETLPKVGATDGDQTGGQGKDLTSPKDNDFIPEPTPSMGGTG